MNIDILKIKTDFTNKTFEISPEELPDRGTVFLNDVITLIISSKKTPLGFKIFGKLYAFINLKCIRCLKDFCLDTDLPIDLSIFTKNNSYSDNSSEIVSNIDEIKNFNIDEMIADMLELAKPNNPLCEKKCKGLCLRCGVNYNYEDCICKKNSINNPFDKLKNYK